MEENKLFRLNTVLVTVAFKEQKSVQFCRIRLLSMFVDRNDYFETSVVGAANKQGTVTLSLKVI